MPDGVERFEDRWLGPQEQDVARAVGDIALRRADGLWAYQLAVVVDDAAQGVTDVVRGADLLSSTARQRMLGRLLDLPLPRHMHVPLILDADSGLKLSSRTARRPSTRTLRWPRYRTPGARWASRPSTARPTRRVSWRGPRRNGRAAFRLRAAERAPGPPL